MSEDSSLVDPLEETERAILDVLAGVTYKNWRCKLHRDPQRAGALYLQWSFTSECCKTGVKGPQFSRKWYLSQWMTESEIVQTAFKAALTAEEHECREFFKYLGHRVFNPHIHVRALMDVCNIEDSRE